MIKYTLQCDSGHGFETWFRSSDEFDKLQGLGLVECPDCGSTSVRKAIMAPNVGVRANRKPEAGPQVGPARPGPASVPSMRPDLTKAPVPAEPVAMVQAAAVATDDAGLIEKTEKLAKLVEAARELRRHVTANAENVGRKFAEEARRIHFEEVEPRAIYGEATPEEARNLHEDGIEAVPLPLLPEDRN